MTTRYQPPASYVTPAMVEPFAIHSAERITDAGRMDAERGYGRDYRITTSGFAFVRMYRKAEQAVYDAAYQAGYDSPKARAIRYRNAMAGE